MAQTEAAEKWITLYHAPSQSSVPGVIKIILGCQVPMRLNVYHITYLRTSDVGQIELRHVSVDTSEPTQYAPPGLPRWQVLCLLRSPSSQVVDEQAPHVDQAPHRSEKNFDLLQC